MSGAGRYARLGLALGCVALLAGCTARYDFEIANEGSRDIRNAVLTSADKTVAIGDIPRGTTASAAYYHVGVHDRDVYLAFDRGGRRETHSVGNFTAYMFWLEIVDTPIVIRDAGAFWPRGNGDEVLLPARGPRTEPAAGQPA